MESVVAPRVEVVMEAVAMRVAVATMAVATAAVVMAATVFVEVRAVKPTGVVANVEGAAVVVVKAEERAASRVEVKVGVARVAARAVAVKGVARVVEVIEGVTV